MLNNIFVFIPIRHESQRVPGKNYRILGDKPLYCHIIDTLLGMPEITGIIIDTNSPVIKEGCSRLYGQSVLVIDRDIELCSPDVSTNALIDSFFSLKSEPDCSLWRINQDQNMYIQTHVTNPFLKAETIRSAINIFKNSEHDSLFTVNVIQSRLYDKDKNPINHEKGVLCQTQDLPKIYQDNSCLYMFTKDSFYKANKNRIGENPYFFPMYSREETVDIDWEEDFVMAEMYLHLVKNAGAQQKVALITGVSGGIGWETAKRFQKEGWYVIGTDIVERSGSSPCNRFINADLTRDALMLCDNIRQTEGQLDALINVAAIQDCSTYDQMTSEKWDQIMTCNLKTPFFLAQQVAPMLEKTKGSVVNVSSIHALQTSDKISCYAISKAGMNGLTRNLAIELGKSGIRVNGVCPGAIDTPMLRAGLLRGWDSVSVSDIKLVEKLGQRHILGKVGQPSDIAAAIYFLASSEASFITGSNMVVDGGATIKLSTE